MLCGIYLKGLGMGFKPFTTSPPLAIPIIIIYYILYYHNNIVLYTSSWSNFLFTENCPGHLGFFFLLILFSRPRTYVFAFLTSHAVYFYKKIHTTFYWYVLKIYRLKIYRKIYQNISTKITYNMQNVYIFLKRASTRFRFYEKVLKKTKGTWARVRGSHYYFF